MCVTEATEDDAKQFTRVAAKSWCMVVSTIVEV